MDRNAHTELTLQAVDRRESATQIERVLMHDSRHADARKYALAQARALVARKRSFWRRLLGL